MYKIIKDSACGQEILDNYEKNKYLSEKYRKLLVKIVVQNLLEYKKKINRQIHSWEKCKYAEAVIELFPNLKNSEGDVGYVSFYISIVIILISYIYILRLLYPCIL